MALWITTGVLLVIVFSQCFCSSFSQPTRENVALNKRCSMTSVYRQIHYNGGRHPFKNGCGAAVNDDRSQIYKPGNCIHSAINDTHPRWTVFLGQNYQIEEIVVYMRDISDDDHARWQDVTLLIDDVRVFHGDAVTGGTIQLPSPTWPLNKIGRSVTVSREGQTENTNSYLLNVCEVQVWAMTCPEGNHPNGGQCVPCGHCANNDLCNNSTGHCPNGCETGNKQTPTCHTECDSHHYGDNCSMECSAGCDGRECTPQAGHCTNSTCLPGYHQTPMCNNTCDPHNYGDNCQQTCSAGCGADGTCDKVNGTCMASTCKPGYRQSAKCDQPCDPHHYGADCQQNCSAGCSGDRTCEKINGTCTVPTCTSGYRQSTKCDRQCDSHHYGDNCSMECSAGCDGRECTPQAGHCTNSTCLPGYQQTPMCNNSCTQGTYGSNCSRQCGAGCDNETCDNVNGTCTCITNNWAHGKCAECARGHYGPASDCQNRCGNGCKDGTCNSDNGNCVCKNGWQPLLCTDCADGFYGDGCVHSCGECADNTTCNKTNGYCPALCSGSFQPPLCQAPCEDSRYGKNCDETCGHCTDDVSCNLESGHCPSCSPGWVPPLCQQQCDAGQYGQNCSEQCGHCLNSTCNASTGQCCDETCEDGFTGALCTLPQTSDPATNVTGIAAGVIVSVLIIIFIVVAILIVMRRRRHGKPNNAEEDRNTNDSTQAETVFSEIKGDQHNSNTNGRGAKPKVAVKPRVVNRQDGAPSAKSTDRDIPASDSSSANTSTDYPLYYNTPQKLPANKGNSGDKRPSIPIKPTRTAGTPLYQNIPMDSSPSDNQQEQNNTAAEAAVVPRSLKRNRAEEETPEEEESDVYNNEDLYACYRSLNSLSMIDSFQKYLLDCLASPEKLSKEFKVFPRGMPNPHEVGSDPANSKKNRFKQLCAYDKNRVILRRPSGDTDTDYINASYIKGYQNDQAYIATQAPRANMINDLWWMIWQEEAAQIVMLTNLQEDGKSKCDQYWPEPGTAVSHGHVTVTALEEDERADFVIRTFIVKAQGDTEREVQQYHYMAWPDHGVPAASSLVDFWQHVTSQATTNMPPIIHCSAGVGRTGTYIALNIAIDRKSHGLDVNVNDIVSELREQRSIMVQTEVQYRFLHEVILEAYTSKDTRMSTEILDAKFPTVIDVSKRNKTIDNEFKLLEEMKQWAKPNNTTAQLEENIKKNRDPNVLPDDKQLVYLSAYVRGRNQYINAIFLSSFRQRRGLILTQLPLQHTLVDLWRLVDSCDVNTIVSLGGKEDEATVKDFCQYWPKAMGKDLRTGPYILSLTSASISMEHLTTFHVDMTKTEKGDSRPVTVLHYTDWSGQLPGNTAGVLHLVEILNSTIKDSTAPVIIQCQDGASRSGLFSVLYDIISRMTCDEAVNVLTTVRHLHSVKPHAVTSQTEYRYCYRMAQEVRQNLRVYANT